MELEDKIRDLAERAARARTEEEAAALLQQLRGALHEHIESVRGKLILASSLTSRTSATQSAPEPSSSSEIKKPPAA